MNGCDTIQLIAADGSVTVVTETDPSLSEHGSVPLSNNQTGVHVDFATTKASDQYRFEYLYVDAFGLTAPLEIEVIPVSQTMFGFDVLLSPVPPVLGYTLRWRVVVESLVPSFIGELDAPQRLYVQLPQADSFTVPLINPRSTTDYGFTELRVENLVDSPDSQTPVWVQVSAKTQSDFTIAINPTPPTSNYFLTARIP